MNLFPGIQINTELLSQHPNINGIKVRQGETLLVPACENVLYIFGNATFLTATM